MTPRPARLLLVAIVALLAACGPSAAGPSTDPSGSPQPSATPEPSPSETPRDEPSEAPEPTDDADGTPSPTPADTPTAFRFGDEVEVTVDGLAVRRFPLTSSPLVVALTTDAAGDRVPAGDVRLNAGHRLWVDLGPIVLDGITWYQVHTGTQPGETEVITWDADGDGEGSDNGWIAGVGEAGDAYLAAVPADPNAPLANPPLVEAGGEADFTSEPFTASFQVVGMYALGTNGEAPCDFRVVLQPTGQVLYETSLTGAFDSGRFATSETEALPEGEYTLEVTAGVAGNPEAGCPWTLTLFQAIG